MPQRIVQPQNNNQVKPNAIAGQAKSASTLKQTVNAIPHSELKQKISELLTHYCTGLWLHALPKVFEDTFKIKFPSDVLNMDVLTEISSVDVICENPLKAILYPKTPQSGGQNQSLLVTNNGQKRDDELSSMEQSEEEELDTDLTPPPLVIPTEASPSVLVVELNNTEEVLIRCVGKDYSAAQELMEDEMKEFYSTHASPVKLRSLKEGQLVACKAEEETWLRAQIQSVEENRIKTVTSDIFVSLPFCGKICLSYSKGKWARVEITSVHSSRALDVQFLDSGTIASVKVSELREIPFPFLKDLISIPPQATRCCLADLPLNIGMWTPDAVLWLRNTVLNCSECSLKVVKIDEAKSMVYVYLFTSRASLDPERSINRQITNEELWRQQKNLLPSVASSVSKGRGDAGTQAAVPKKDQSNVTKKPSVEQATTGPSSDLPPPLPLPRSGEHIDVYVSVACHPGHFVFQPWQELHKLEVLMEEMLLHYSTTEEKQIEIEKNKLYAAKVDNKWYRVLLKGILTNGLVSVYELDYGRHELVNSRQVQPLIDKFRQLPFQAVTSQLAGVKCEQWSEEAAIVFRNHVEKKPLVALIQEIHESTNPWNRKVVAYVVDTTLPDTDIWIHDLMSEYLVELSKSD
ncbi:hypothetical protein GDO81_001446 [Engystomops pustulosus]|nr:hypothetical protein GDO81_001446 [Engystomops pustulosus]